MLKDLEKELKRRIRKHRVPGASVAVLRGKRIVANAAAGVVNIDTRVRTTTDTLFQIGSITKPFTATMILQLRDEGKLTLDDCITKHLPYFRIADIPRLKKITIRRLLSHTSGIDGDFFPRTDSGDRAIGQLLEMSAMLPTLFAPGSNFSYCNIGFVILGRIVEVLDGRVFDHSLKKRIFEPLGMKHALSLPEDNIRYRVAVGHLPDPKKPRESMVPENAFLSFGMKSAGSTPAMTAENLLRFAAMHIHDGVGLNGTRVLSRRSIREMRKRHFPEKRQRGKFLNEVGLAWMLHDWDGHKLFSHSGGTVGQYSHLVVSEQKKTAVAILTNGGNAGEFMRELLKDIAKSTVRMPLPDPPKPSEGINVKPDELVGAYENINFRIEISEDDGKLYLLSVSKTEESKGKQHNKQLLGFAKPRQAVIGTTVIDFDDTKGKRAEWLRVDSRLFSRTG